MTEKEKACEEIFAELDKLESLYNNDYITLKQYWIIKNRILDRLVAVYRYFDS